MLLLCDFFNLIPFFTSCTQVAIDNWGLLNENDDADDADADDDDDDQNTDRFSKFSSVTICWKFAIQPLLNFPPHLKRVATLPCEKLMSEN